MPPRGLTNPTPKTESARSALSSFTCTLCNKSYSRQPEYEAHISSYDHQHRKRLQDLKQLSRDPNAAEKARRAEKKADAEAGLRVINTSSGGGSGSGGSGAGAGVGVGGSGTTAGAGGGGGGFKKGGFKSSFSSVKGPPAPVAPTKKNVLEDDDEEDEGMGGGRAAQTKQQQAPAQPLKQADQGESDTDEEYSNDQIGGGYYDPHRPTGCSVGCAGAHTAMV